MKVRGAVIVITGAGSGIGRELSLHLLELGAYVAGVDLNEAALRETEALAQPRDNFATFTVDISNSDAVDKLPGQVIERFGRVDAIINNAGIIQPFKPFAELEQKTIERLINVNLYGPIFVIRAFLPHLGKSPAAHIINLSSMGAFLPVPGQTIYCATKAAVKLLTEGLAAELKGTNVKVSAVFPGAIATNIMQNSGLNQPASGATRSSMKATSARVAAETIVKGMERDFYHIYIGNDSIWMNRLTRLSPEFAARWIGNKMRPLMTKRSATN
jgi:NAD(P)-dependent dehydrogenase (short-subunit alcohol dehydrogenase family)